MAANAESVGKLPGWYRALAVTVGVICIALAFTVLIYPDVGVITLIFLLAFALIIIGIDRLVAGISGHSFSQMAMAQRGGGTQK